MRNFSRAAAIALSATAFTAFLTPAAEAQSGARLTVCVRGDGDRATDVDINRSGRGGERDGDADPCVTFRNLRSGLYLVDIDPSRRFRVANGDDDRWVRLSSGESERITFRLERRDRDHDFDFDRDHDGWDHDDDDDDSDDDDWDD